MSICGKVHPNKIPIYLVITNCHICAVHVELFGLTCGLLLGCIKQALVAIKNLLQLRTTEARVFKDFCALGDALKNLRQLLHDLMEDEYQRDYVMDVESLRVEVEHNFQRKLVKQ